jgi:sugar phosphate isomerase/epimerase
MSPVSRRGFVAGGAGLAAGALAPRMLGSAAAAEPVARAAAPALPGGLLPPERIGLQLYSVSDKISELGFAKVLEELAGIGYKLVEFAGYTQGSSPELTTKELRKLLDDNGLAAIGSHVSPSDDESMKKIIEDAGVLGIPNVGISLPLPSQGPTTAGWKALSAEYNHYGEMAAKEGIGFYLHNHFHEWFATPDDPSKRGEDVLLAETDPRYVFFEMDIYWAHVGQWQSGQAQQFDPLTDYAIPFRDRYKLFHVKDGKKDASGGFTDAFNDIVDAGQGSIDFQTFFTTLFEQSPDEVNKHHYLWERDNASSHPRGSLASARASYSYVRTGLTGPNAPVPATEDIPAAVTGVVIRRKGSRRVVHVTLESEAPVNVTLAVRRGSRTLARKRTAGVAAGRHTLELPLPRKTKAGHARLVATFAVAGGKQHKLRVPLAVPKRR